MSVGGHDVLANSHFPLLLPLFVTPPLCLTRPLVRYNLPYLPAFLNSDRVMFRRHV